MKKILPSFIALAAVVSCVQETGVQEPQIPQMREVSIVADAETKTLLDGNDVVWEANDAIALVFNNADAAHVETFTTIQSGTTAEFVGKLPNDVSVEGGYDAAAHAVYPSSAVSDEGVVSFSLPTAVTVSETGSFDSGKNLSSANVSLEELDAAGTTSASFKNAFSIIRFSLSSDVVSLKLSSDAALVGDAVMKFDDEGRLVVDAWTTESKSVTVLPTGASFTSGQVYNVLVYPGVHQTITAELTDTDGCKYVKSVTGPFTFEASKFYTFTFATKFEKSYTFTASGRTFAEGDQIQTVFGTLHTEVLTAAADASFTGNLPAEVVHQGTEGYAIYPASAYNLGTITYDLDPLAPAELFSAVLRPTSTAVVFNSVSSALATVKLSVPAGVESVKIASTKGIVGNAAMTVSSGNLVAGAGEGTEINLETPNAGNYNLTVYPVQEASLTVTLTDAAGATVVKYFTLSVEAGKSTTIDVGDDLKFDKGGNFTGDSFTDGGEFEF